MTRLLYIASMRLPTEKAHGLQIVQNCEAFAQQGVDVALWVPNRFNTPEMRAVPDVYAHYGVAPVFQIRRFPTIDLLPLVPDRTDTLARLIFYVQYLTFALSVLVAALFTPADVIYSRDALVLYLLSWFKPGRVLAYEAHQLAVGRAGKRLQQAVIRRVGAVVTITAPLRDDLIAGDESLRPRFLVAHDGVRRERFTQLPTRAKVRREIGWPDDAFIVGYVGRLHTLQQDKGVGTVIAALADVPGVSLALVGGPDDMAEELRTQWAQRGLPAEGFRYVGQVPPEAVPRYLAAFDACVMPHPPKLHFARHTSPLKLFEYMASGRAVIASNLPAWADVVRDGDNALLVPPSDVAALAAAVRRLRDDPALRERIGAQARADALAHYTWDARTGAILAHIAR